jgi:DNA-binding transcriptional LysR family regulator
MISFGYHMELRDLGYFAAIAEHRGVRRAAEALNLSQPGLSKSLRRLEHELGTKLVARTPKGIELTAVGSALAGHVRQLQLNFEDVVREAAELSTGRGGHLRVGVNPLYADLLPEAYAVLQKEAPNVTFSATDSDNDVLVPALQKGELDLIVNYIPESPIAGCAIEPLPGDYDIVVYAAASHPLTRKRIVTLADLAGQGWVLSPINVLPWHWLSLAFQKQGQPPPRVAFETRSVRLRLQVVAVSRHLGFLARQVIQQAAPQFRLKELPVKDANWRRPIGVIYRKGAYLSPAAQRFIDILKVEAKRV